MHPEHARYLYKLQDATAGSEESDDERYDSDGSSYRRSRKRMSIMTNRYIDMDVARAFGGDGSSRARQSGTTRMGEFG
jgi:hypothetical protein